MKNLLLSLILVFNFAGKATTQTITVHFSGTVTRDSTGVPVSSHQVIIQADSNAYGFTFYTTRTTNPNGFYDCTIHDVPATGAAVTFVVKTKNCDSTFLTQTFIGTSTAAVVNFIICNENSESCQALYHYYVDSTDLLRLHFYDASTPANMIATRLWHFGDGGTSTNYDPWHTYAEPGIYNVCLTITTTDGCTSEKCDEIHVGTTVDVHGSVYAGDSFVDHALVDLIRSDAGGVMTVVDSREINDSLGSYWFGGVLPGHYYLRATLLSSSSFFGQFVPTYYIDAINWTTAHLVELGQPNNPYDIHMVHNLNYNSGTGTISGMISQNTKIAASGTPVPNVEVLLLNSSNEPLSYTVSDQEGNFEFGNVAFGSYSIYPEMPGKYTTPTIVTLDNTHPSVTTAFTIQGTNILGVYNQTSGFTSGISEIFPNPSIEKAHITISAVQETGINLSVYFITGQVASVFQFTLERGVNKLTIPVKNLSGGLYYVSIKDERGTEVIRKMIIRKLN